jgi:hypothetical protein
VLVGTALTCSLGAHEGSTPASPTTKTPNSPPPQTRPTGFRAQAALDAARGLHTNTAERVERQILSSLQAELFQARTTVNQLRTELARHLETVNPTTAHLGERVAGAARSLAGLGNVISRIHRQLERRGRRR